MNTRLLALLTLASCSSLAASPGSPIIGVAIPQVKMDAGSVDPAEAVRQSLLPQLQGHSVRVIVLTSAAEDAEAAEKHCDYVLHTRVEQKHSAASLLGKLAPLASVLPVAGVLGHGGAGMAAQTVGQVAQSTAMNAAAQSQQQAMEQMMGWQHSSVRRGDTLTVDYRLTATGTGVVVTAGSLKGKADADSQNVLGPLVEQLGGAVAGSLGAAPAATATQSNASQGGANAHASMFGGLFKPKAAAAPTPSPSGSQSFDCAQVAAVPNSPLTVEQCQKMQSAQQTYERAASDPGASHPGDDQMSCSQIIAELKQQQYTRPDQAKVAAAQATAASEQSTLMRQQGQVNATVAEETAQMRAASAADTATAAATAGIVRGRATEVVGRQIDARNKAEGERMAAERKPTETKMLNQTADFAADAAQSVAANPRIGRLMQLAQARQCKGS